VRGEIRNFSISSDNSLPCHLLSLRGAERRGNLLQCKYLNLRDCFVVKFILSIAEGLLAMTGEKTFYDFVIIHSIIFYRISMEKTINKGFLRAWPTAWKSAMYGLEFQMRCIRRDIVSFSCIPPR